MFSNLKTNYNNRGYIWPVSVAPMMDCTDRHFRYFMRLITKHTFLYTEMVTTGAIIHGNRDKFLSFSKEELPLSLQLGGDNPNDLSKCAEIAESYGYTEVNLNVGCPSSRVQSGNFGACLMSQPELVAKCVFAMKEKVNIPVTVKHRIGIDGLEDYDNLKNFVEVVSKSGCDKFSVHARIAILGGLSPLQNRTIPPLRYDDVYKLKEEFPNLCIEINGGIKTIADFKSHLSKLDSVMIGREAYDNPYLFSLVDDLFFNDKRILLSRKDIIEKMIPYVQNWHEKGFHPNRILIHMRGLFHNKRGSKVWKRILGEYSYKRDECVPSLYKALDELDSEILNEIPSLYSNTLT